MPAKRHNPELDSYRVARVAEVRERVRRLQRENAIAEGRVVEAADVNRLLEHISHRMRSILLFKLGAELPGKLAGLDAAEIRAQLRDAGDAVLTAMQPIVDDFQWSQPPRLDNPHKTQAKAVSRPKKGHKK